MAKPFRLIWNAAILWSPSLGQAERSVADVPLPVLQNGTYVHGPGVIRGNVVGWIGALVHLHSRGPTEYRVEVQKLRLRQPTTSCPRRSAPTARFLRRISAIFRPKIGPPQPPESASFLLHNPRFPYGAGAGNRTPISSLGSSRVSLYTTPAFEGTFLLPASPSRSSPQRPIAPSVFQPPVT